MLPNQQASEISIDITLRQNTNELQESLTKLGYSKEHVSQVFQTEDKAALKEMITALANRDFQRIVQF